MKPRTKLIALDLSSMICGWVFVFSSLVTVYFLAVAIFGSAPWSYFLGAFGSSIIAILLKWLLDSERQRCFIEQRVAAGMSYAEASTMWDTKQL